MSKDDAARANLEARLALLLRRAGRIEQDLRQTHDLDWEERATEVAHDDVLVGLDESILAEVKQIREALQRIERGSYGTCSTCGQPIGLGRLAAVPSTATCIRCVESRS